MPKHAKPAYEVVADVIQERIYGGEYPPGSLLPSRVELREQFGRSDQVIGWAMRILHGRGLIETLHGVGVQVAETLPPRLVKPE
jgi:GntR family transcriptional regulator